VKGTLKTRRSQDTQTVFYVYLCIIPRWHLSFVDPELLQEYSVLQCSVLGENLSC